jgi:hypothetical protein
MQLDKANEKLHLLGQNKRDSPPTSVDVKNTWIYKSTPPYVFMAWCLVSWAQEQLYLYLG